MTDISSRDGVTHHTERRTETTAPQLNISQHESCIIHRSLRVLELRILAGQTGF